MNKVIKFAIGNNIRDVNLRNVKLSWDDFKSHILNPAKKSIDYNVIAGSNNADKLTHAEIIKRAIASIKPNLQYFVGGYFNPLKRNNSNIKARTLIVLDIDNYQGTIDDLAKTIASDFTNYDYIAYATASHRANKPCIRVVLRCSEEIEPNIYKNIAEAFVKDLSFKDSIDIKASTTSSQAMYLPAIIAIESQPDNEEPYVYEYWTQENIGEPINIKHYSAQVAKIQNKPLAKISNPDVHDYNHVAVSMEKVIDCLNKYPVDKLDFHGWLEVAMALHHNYQGANEGYRILDEWSRKDARYDEPNNRRHWDSFKSKSKIKTFASIIKIVNEQDKRGWKKDILHQIRNLKEDFDEELDLIPIISGIAQYCSLTESEYYIREIKGSTKLGLTFIRSLIHKEYKKIAIAEAEEAKNKIFPITEALPAALFNGYGVDDSKIKTTISNLKILIKYYGITIRRNLISREDEIIIPNCTFNEETKDEASFATLTSLCELNNLTKSHHLNSYCSSIASENSYNPILDYVLSKPWDGKSRLDEIYDTIILEEGFSPKLAKLLVRKWLISMVAAVASEKGIFSKGVLLFQSKQSIGKTTWFKNMMPKGLEQYFKDGAHLDPTDKDCVRTIISHVVVELGEIDSTFKRDVARLKAFISSDKDIFRIKYGKKDTKFARRTVFCGTVNQKEVLKDRTGNVRFWVISIIKLLSTGHIDMQQLWAELYEIYKSGERWWLEKDEEDLLEQSNENFLETCPYEETVKKYLRPYSNNIKNCPETNKKTATEILIQIKNAWGSVGNIDQRGTRAVASALNRLGFRRESGNKRRYYVEPVMYKKSDEIVT